VGRVAGHRPGHGRGEPAAPVSLTDEQVERYSRQIILREIGGIGQRRLLASRCLLRGTGPALACAATYLAGAGVGHLCMEPSASERALAFAPLAERNSDVDLRVVQSGEDRGAYELCIDTTGGRADDARGVPRYGEIAVDASPRAVGLRIVPSRAGCLACRGAPADAAGTRANPIDAAAAGAMAALAALRWLAELDQDAEPRRLTLARGAPTWTEATLGPTATCPRPCRRRGSGLS